MPTREEMHNLAQGIIASFEARTAGIASLREEVKGDRQATQAQLGELNRSHQAMAHQLRADLARGGAALTALEARRKVEVNTWLKEVDRDHQAMARRQRADLGRGRAVLSGVEARRKAVIHEWIAQVAREHAGAHQEWQRLAATLGAKRHGAPARVAPVHEEEEAVARAVVGPVTEELTTLGDRVFQHLANHPDGTRLTEIEREFGLARLQAARVVRHLMDEGKAEKRGLSYFAT